MSTLTLVRVAVVRRFVEMSWTCRPWAPDVYIRVAYSTEESRFLNKSHITPLGRGHRPRPSNGLLHTQLPGTESAGEKSALVSDSAPAFGPSPVPVASGQVQSRTDGMSSP